MLENLPKITTLCKTIDISDQEILQESFEREDIADLINALATKLAVNCTDFDLDNYFPWKPKSFFIKKKNNVGKAPLTLSMFIDSAKAGRWLYG